MTDLAKGFRFIKPSGEPIPLPPDEIDTIGKHGTMPGTVVFMDDGTVIHTNLPFYMVTDEKSLAKEAEEIMEEEGE